MDEPQKHYVKRMMPVTKADILYDPIYINFPQQTNAYRQKVDSWLPWVEETGARRR